MDVTCAIPSGIACRAIRNKRSFPRRRSGSGRVLGVDYCKHEQEAQSDWWGGWEGGLVKERGSKDKRGWKALLITSVILCSQYSPKQQFWSESLQVSSRSSTREAQGEPALILFQQWAYHGREEEGPSLVGCFPCEKAYVPVGTETLLTQTYKQTGSEICSVLQGQGRIFHSVEPEPQNHLPKINWCSGNRFSDRIWRRTQFRGRHSEGVSVNCSCRKAVLWENKRVLKPLLSVVWFFFFVSAKFPFPLISDW